MRCFEMYRARVRPACSLQYRLLVSQPSPKEDDTVQAKVELLAAEAKKHNGAGEEAKALECYRQAAELMPGAPWLQHRTAELARKLKQLEVAVLHYRRAAAAFIVAGFPKRALAPLRNAWQASLSILPAQSGTFAALTLELAHVQRELGFQPEAFVSIANANQALRACGASDRVPSGSEVAPPESGINASVARPVAALARQPDKAASS
jgi:tetratricopeptide (TPR) repeat protein